MSNMSFMEKLLDGVEVEWLPLGEVTELKRGKRLVKSQLESTGQFAVYQNSMTPLGYYHQSNTNPDTTFVICAGAAGEVGYSAAPFWAADDVHYINSGSQLDSKYLYHFILTQKGKILSHVRRASIPRLSKTVLDKLLVPIPCPDNPEKSLAIQSEIVRILDKFTALTAELTAELNMRKKQYNYYRDKLLSFEEGEVEYLPMGDERVGEFIRGGTFQKKDFTDFGVGCIHYGQIYTYYGTYTNTTKTFISESLARKCRKAESGNLIIATTSENDDDVCKAVAWLGYDDIAVSSDACIYKHKLNPKYVSYFFQTECFQRQKKQYITGAKVRRVNASNLAQILIPVPSPEEQARIVAILDKFDALTSSITEGLPREIELRQKQYEYYRDLLLSFPKSHSDEAA
ncbi:restriction endonuclease subunit S [Providencia rettgeri]|nr:restriction endonuclease subunit S [Providencia rettgeri]QPE18411.1 restriction endonuclease subunit S [Providencia rettgeri]